MLSKWHINVTYHYSLGGHLGFFSLKIMHKALSIYRIFFHSVRSLSHVWLLQPHGLQHARPSCPSPTLGVYSNSCPLHRWCLPTISSSVISFSSHLQSFPASGSFPMSQFFASGGQSIQVFSFSISPSNEYSGLISFRIDWFSSVRFPEIELLGQRSWIYLRLLLNIAKLLSTKTVPVYPHQ